MNIIVLAHGYVSYLYTCIYIYILEMIYLVSCENATVSAGAGTELCSICDIKCFGSDQNKMKFSIVSLISLKPNVFSFLTIKLLLDGGFWI